MSRSRQGRRSIQRGSDGLPRIDFSREPSRRSRGRPQQEEMDYFSFSIYRRETTSLSHSYPKVICTRDRPEMPATMDLPATVRRTRSHGKETGAMGKPYLVRRSPMILAALIVLR